MKKLLLLLVMILLPKVASADDSGKCGENVTYTYAEATKTLTLSGSGKMDDFSTTSQPWYVYNEDIEKVIIEDGVTTIGSFAFNNLSNLHTVTIPGSVVSIRASSFTNCESLYSLDIPEGVDSIHRQAFYRCLNLKSILIPSTLKYFGIKCFHLSNLEKVEVASIASWCNISFEGGGANPCQYAHKLFHNGEEIIDLVIPENVTKISGYAFFNCSNIKSVSLPNSLTDIGEFSFSGCSSLSTIVVPNSFTSIGKNAFCNCTGLRSIEIPNSVTSIGSYAFSDCPLLESINIPNSVTSIGEYAFLSCYSLQRLELPNSLQSISNNLFNRCTTLSSVTIPQSVTSIGNRAFSGCYSLNEILCYAEEIPTCTLESFESAPLNEIRLYVPENSVASYKSNTYYNGFKEILPLTEYGSRSADAESINKKIECTVQWNGEYSSSVTPWASKYSRGIDIKVSNKTNEDLKIANFQYFFNDGEISSVPNAYNIRVNNGETKIISFSLETSTEPTTLPHIKMCYKIGNIDYVKIAENTETTSSINNLMDSNLTIKEIYDYHGHRLNQVSKGLNIIRTSDGKTKKVVIK